MACLSSSNSSDGHSDGMPLMRCASTGDLYPIITTTTNNQATSPSTLAALSPTLCIIVWDIREHRC
ncbi:hypothetical protein RND71_031298 [Anisodus tanguticus]|uniref:Uncharacterized protein n=1 Tax=Anisodus tanguticus TaxID=243964 RepID=A0AAE1RC82_9SOLA|nr:hypothetical protein RND71_031298 [Anisodus tanguticus]